MPKKKPSKKPKKKTKKMKHVKGMKMTGHDGNEIATRLGEEATETS